ncbi:MAG TPA: DUF3097 family protein [Mycobacteriales bacterium]
MEYGDILGPRPTVEIPVHRVEPGLVVEELVTDFCGAVIDSDTHTVTLEDRFGKRRTFPYATGGFRLDGALVTLAPAAKAGPVRPTRTASGSVAVDGVRARVARHGRILVEGVHDAALVERVWGDDLRVEGVVVETLDGIDNLDAVIRAFGPAVHRRLGVLVDHLVPGSKESRLIATVRASHVLVLGHPYVDVWQAVKPASLGIPAWPTVPRGLDWKQGVCDALGESGGPREMWRRVLAAVDSYTDIEVPMLRAMEELIDFVTVTGTAAADGGG